MHTNSENYHATVAVKQHVCLVLLQRENPQLQEKNFIFLKYMCVIVGKSVPLKHGNKIVKMSVCGDFLIRANVARYF